VDTFLPKIIIRYGYLNKTIFCRERRTQNVQKEEERKRGRKKEKKKEGEIPKKEGKE
jgi:hypothetical protein